MKTWFTWFVLAAALAARVPTASGFPADSRNVGRQPAGQGGAEMGSTNTTTVTRPPPSLSAGVPAPETMRAESRRWPTRATTDLRSQCGRRGQRGDRGRGAAGGARGRARRRGTAPGPAGHRHGDPAGHVRGAAHRRPGRRTPARRPDRGGRRQGGRAPAPADRRDRAGDHRRGRGAGVRRRRGASRRADHRRRRQGPPVPARGRPRGRRPGLRPGRLPGPGCGRGAAGHRRRYRRSPGRPGRRPAGARPGRGDHGDRPLGRHPARARRAGLLPGPPGPCRGPRPACPDQPALHLQRAVRDRLVRADRPRTGPGPDPGVRRVHPVLVPGARRVHHARRGAALDRPVPDHRAGPVRRAAAGTAADRARGAAGRAAVPVPAAPGGERGAARTVP